MTERLPIASPAQGSHLTWQAYDVDKASRRRLNGHGSAIVWFTGLSASGKSTIANLLEAKLHSQGIRTYVLDGDNVRHGLNRNLGFDRADRAENIRRVAEVAQLMVDAGIVVIAAFVSPFRLERALARELLQPGEFIEVFVDAPLAVVQQRDPKGLYLKAREGKLQNLPGVDAPYEAPLQPEVRIDTMSCTPHMAAEQVLRVLEERLRIQRGSAGSLSIPSPAHSAV